MSPFESVHGSIQEPMKNPEEPPLERTLRETNPGRGRIRIRRSVVQFLKSWSPAGSKTPP